MSLRLLADHCISKAIIDAILEMGHDVVRLKDVLPPDSADPLIVTRAKEIDSILISLNGDFADIITYPPNAYEGSIALQVKNHPEVIEVHSCAGCAAVTHAKIEKIASGAEPA